MVDQGVCDSKASVTLLPLEKGIKMQPKVTEGWDSQGVLPGVGHPWLEVTFLGSRGRLHSLPQADGSLESLVLGPDNCVQLGKLWNLCVPLLPHLLTENSRSGVVVENWVGGL